ncbi:MAG: urease accessory protein UreD [Oscillospiraceae bacterium]
MSSLYLRAEKRNERTIIAQSSFTAPLKITKPFYMDDCTKVILMAASPGMLDGDSYDISVEVNSGASLCFTGQSYTKIFRAEKQGAVQKADISVGENSFLFYRPMPVIPFEKSIFRGITSVRLCRSSKFIMYDIISCGRAAMGERFLFSLFRTRTSVFVDNRLVFLDNQRLSPEEAPLSGIGFFEGHTHAGMMYLYGFPDITAADFGEAEIAVSRAREGFCVRAAADSADEIARCFDSIAEYEIKRRGKQDV